jgi:uncharacterized protein (TIGR02268 family)
VTGNPADRPHEIRVARGIATLLRFKSQLNRNAVEVDGRGTRITVDAGDSSIILEPLIDLGSTERLVLRVPFADGKAPAQAAFVLVSSPSEVDTRIDVVRHEQTVESCQAELAEAQARCSELSPARFARAGWLTRQGVTARRIIKCNGATQMDGLVCDAGTAYRAETWALLDVKIRNESNDQPWTPSEVILKDMKSGVQVAVRAVEMDAAQIGPGEAGYIFVEVDPASHGGPFALELRDSAGPGITVPFVDLNAQESKR